MEVTRLLSLVQYDRTRKRFRDFVYKNSAKVADPDSTPDGRGGFSVIELACACDDLADNDCICAHIAQFYGQVAPEPCAYWKFDTAIFGIPNPNPNRYKQAVIVNEPSDSGDECHRNIHCVTDGRLKNEFQKAEAVPQDQMYLCVDGVREDFTSERAIELVNQFYPDPA